MSGLYISQINHEETKAAPSQGAWADGFKSLLHKYTEFQLVPSLASSLSLGNQCRDAGAAGSVWGVTLPSYLGFRCLSSLWPGYPGCWRIEFICFLPSTSCDSVSTGWESISFPVEVSLAYEPLLWSFISVFLHHALLQVKFRGDRTLVQCNGEETMNKDEDSSF